MAKKLEQTRNSANFAKDEPVQIASLRNLTGLDADQLLQDVSRVITLSEDAKEAGVPVSEQKKLLKSERGYHMGGFATCVRLERMDPVEARDFWMTLRTYAEHRGLNTPDLVDMAGAGNA